MRRILGLTAVGFAALMSATAQAATFTGATVYGNPFIGSSNTAGSNSGGSTTVSQVSSIDNVVNQTEASGGLAGRIQSTSSPAATNGYMQFVASAPFTAGTVISVQNVAPFFTTPMSFDLLLDGNTIQSGAGTSPSSPIVVTAVPFRPVTAQTLRLNIAMSTYPGQGTTTFADMNEVLILPDSLAVVPSTATATGTAFGSASNLNDLKGGTSYWGGGNGSSVTLTFTGGTKTISALVLSNLETLPGSSAPLTFNILNDASVIVATGSLNETNSVAEFVGVKFNTPVTTSSLTLNFTNPGGAGLIEIIPFESIPEPASLGLIGLGAVGLLGRKRQRSK